MEYRRGDGREVRGVDLLTVVTHELGHVLAFDSIDPAIQADDWMTATLAAGVRRLPSPLAPLPEGEGSLLPIIPGQERSPDLRVVDLFAFDFLSSLSQPVVNQPEPLAIPVLPLLTDSGANAASPLVVDDFDLAEPMPAGDGDHVLLGGLGTELLVGKPGEMILIGGFA